METKTFRKMLMAGIVLSIFLINSDITFGMYDPQIGRFTSRDPIERKFEEPLTLHRYLYCLNEPVNHTDPTGKFTIAEMLVSNSIANQLRGLDLKFSMQLFGESIRAADIFNVYGLEQAVYAERLMAEFEGGLTRTSINSLVSTFNFCCFEPNRY